MLVLSALCALCSVRGAMATQLLQDSLSVTRRARETVIFSCGELQQCDYDYVFWFQKKDTETFRVILRFDKGDGDIDSGGGVVKPVVGVYPAASWLHVDQKKTSLLCLASDMFPPLVKFSWMRQKKKNGRLEDLGPADGEQLELTESGRTAGVLLISQTDAVTYQYRCSVHHEGGTVEAPSAQSDEAASCPSDTNPPNSSARLHPDLLFQLELRLKMFCFFYLLLMVKSLLFSCGLVLISVSTNGHVHARWLTHRRTRARSLADSQTDTCTLAD